MTVAGSILEQLGGHRFQTMTGARDFIYGDRRLSFRLPSAKDGISQVTIAQDGSNTYTVTFARLRGLSSEIRKVSIDTLRQVFYEATGLQCSS
jgi:hypothetical protein